MAEKPPEHRIEMWSDYAVRCRCGKRHIASSKLSRQHRINDLLDWFNGHRVPFDKK